MVHLVRFAIKTQGECEIRDITPEVCRELSRQTVRNGIVTVFTSSSTAGITTLEYESGLLQDFKQWMERMIPKSHSYAHNRYSEDNGHSHIRAGLIGPSLTVPFQEKKLLLGTWQQIVFLDFDTRPRQREILLQFIG